MGGLIKTGWDYVNDPLGTQSTDNAVQAQRDSAGEANQFLSGIYNQQRSDLEPYRNTGLSALAGLGNPDFQRDFTMADFQADPGYAFRMAEGQKAIERSAAARGGLYSGATGKALTQYGQDYASNEFGKAVDRFNANQDRRFGRLATLAGIGQNATNTGIGAAGNYGEMVSGNITGMGNAIAAANLAKGRQNAEFSGGLISLATSRGMGGGK